MLALITSYFNPTHCQKLKDNYVQFRKHLNHPIVTVELAFNDQPFFINDAIHIRGTDKNLLWQKERLLNIALESLPNNVDKVAWLDADIIFENSNWFQETEKKLDSYKVVQPFEYVSEDGHYSDPAYENTPSFGKFIEENPDQSQWLETGPWPSVGLVWSARRDVLSNGFYDKDVVGSSDTYQLLSWLGLWNQKMVQLLTPHNRKEYLLWAWQSYEAVKGDIGSISGNIKHLYHGKKSSRQYFDRIRILVENEFCASKDITLDSQRLYQWNSNKPLFHQSVKQYFVSRSQND